jgi:hypothetical protein
MDTNLTAIETTGTINENHQLQLDNPLPITGPRRVRVIVLYPPTDEWTETEWLQAGVQNPAFDFLADPQEDIYTLNDGKPFNDKA